MALTQRQRSRKLRAYRKEQARIAWERDGGICRRCGRPGSEVHHARGRGNWNTREQYERADYLITLCWICHQRCHHVAPLIPKEELVALLEGVLR